MRRARRPGRRPKAAGDREADLGGPAVSGLADFGVPLRWRGAEAGGAAGSVFDFRQQDVRDLYRGGRLAATLNNRCLRCATDDVLAVARSTGRSTVKVSSKHSCDECRRAAVAEKRRTRMLETTAEVRRKEEEDAISTARARRRRLEYASMFKPQPRLPSRRMRKRKRNRSKKYRLVAARDSSGGGDGDGDGDDCGNGGGAPVLSSSEEEDEGHDDESTDEDEVAEEIELMQPPPQQLESLLPVAIKSKAEFLAALDHHRTYQAELAEIRVRAREAQRSRRAEALRASADAATQARHDEVLSRALVRLRQREVSAAFSSWSANAAWLRQLRRVASLGPTHLLRTCVTAWQRQAAAAKIDRLCAAVVVQAYARRHLARSRAGELDGRRAAARCMQRFARAGLARGVLRLALRQRERREGAARDFLRRTAGSLSLRVLRAWRLHARSYRLAHLMACRSADALAAAYLQRWRLNAAQALRERRRAATACLQRVGRGFVARLRSQRQLLERQAATTLQCNVRKRLARNRLRTKLRQRRVVRRKLQRSLGCALKMRFLTWRATVGQLRTLRRIMGGTRLRALGHCFARWRLRRDSALDVQRVFRGWKGRRLGRLRRQEVLREMASSGCSSLGERERMALLFDARFESELLGKLRGDLLRVLRLRLVRERQAQAREAVRQGVPEDAAALLAGFTEAELEHPGEVTLDVHIGASQTFLVDKHASFLVEHLSRAVEQEVRRLQAQMESSFDALRRETEEWQAVLRDFLGAAKEAELDMRDYQTYPNAGASFDLVVETKEQAREVLAGWKRLHVLGSLPAPTLVAWISNALLLRKGVRARERLLVWEEVRLAFDGRFVEDLVGFMLLTIKKNGTRPF